MNYAIFLSLLNLILISRLRLLFKDHGATRKDAVFMGLLPCILLPFLEINAGWWFLLVWLIIYPWLFFKSEKGGSNRNRNRMVMLLLPVLIIGLLASPLSNLAFNAVPCKLAALLESLLTPNAESATDWMRLQVLLFGFLLVINESNILLRYLFNVFGLEPMGKAGDQTDEKEYNTGRLIGILERIFVFIFVLLAQYTAIGFILAAKGVARFQDFKSRTFAEYVLIGTLLSTLLAMAVGYMIILLS